MKFKEKLYNQKIIRDRLKLTDKDSGGTKVYALSGLVHPSEVNLYAREPEITLNWARYSPASSEIGEPRNNKKRGIIYLPGCMLTERDSTEEISRAFADQYELPVFAVHTQPSTSLDKSLLYEAEVIRKFILESGLDEIIIVANSQGTIRALRLIESMQEKKHTGYVKNLYGSRRKEENAVIAECNLDHKDGKDTTQTANNTEQMVKGLVLLAPVGVAENKKLARKFFADAALAVTTLIEKGLVGEGNLRRTVRTGVDITRGFFNEFRRSPRSFPRRFNGAVEEMSHPFEGKIYNVTTVMISDPDDGVSNLDIDILPRIFGPNLLIIFHRAIGHGSTTIYNISDVAKKAFGHVKFPTTESPCRSAGN